MSEKFNPSERPLLTLETITTKEEARRFIFSLRYDLEKWEKAVIEARVAQKQSEEISGGDWAKEIEGIQKNIMDHKTLIQKVEAKMSDLPEE